MKLVNISLGNFRGYLAEKQIPFSPHLTILLGPNGFGKSTVLDAFEWLLSGQIARYQRRDEARRDDFIRHVDGDEEPYVQAVLAEESGNYTLRRERRSIERSTLRLLRQENEGWMSNAKSLEVLAKLDSGIRPDNAKGIVFSEPFIAYHLLGQQTMQDFVLSEPRDRYDKLAPIIGVERYVKATEAVLAANRRLVSLLEDSSRKLNLRQADFERLRIEARGLDATFTDSGQGASDSAEWFAREYGQLRNRLPEAIKAKLPDKLPDGIANIVDHLSSLLPDTELLLAAQVTDAQRRLSLTSSLERSLESLDEKRSAEQRQTIADADKDRYAALPRHIEFVRAQIQDLEVRLTRLNGENEQLQKQQDEIKALKEARSQYVKLAAELDIQEQEQTTLHEQTAVTEKSLSDCLSEIARITQLLERSKEGSIAVASRLLSTEKLLSEMRALQGTQGRAQEAQRTVDKVYREIGVLSTEINKTKEELEQLDATEVAAKQELNAASQNVRSYQQLLSQLRLYVAGSECPVCGTHFSTREEMLAKIDAKLTGENPQLVELSNRIQLLSLRSGYLRSQLEAFTRDLRQRQREREEAAQAVNQWALKQDELRIAGAQVQLSIGTNLSKDTSLLEDALVNLRSDNARFQSQIAQQQSALLLASDKRASAEAQIEKLRVRGKRLLSEIEDIRQAITKADRRSAEIARSLSQFDLSPEAVEGRRLDLVNSSGEVQKQIDEVKGFITKARNELGGFEAELRTLMAQRERLATTRQEVLQLESDIGHRAVTVGLHPGQISSSELKRIQQNISAELAAVNESKSFLDVLIKTLELAKQRLLSEAHRARVANLKAEIDELQKKCETLTQSKDITDVLAEKVRQAGERRTSRILASCNSLVENYYNRMYPHPLWSKLEIAVDEDPSRGGRAQLVMSARRNHVVKEGFSTFDSPKLNVKYSFSTGQLNLFALSLVLALAQLRHGEAFGTILLDDPVQSMDDIRIAELCWILLQIARTRQVVVATSNQNFVELLFHRAAPFKQDLSIVAHLFESMTSIGPEIRLNWRNNRDKSLGQRVA